MLLLVCMGLSVVGDRPHRITRFALSHTLHVSVIALGCTPYLLLLSLPPLPFVLFAALPSRSLPSLVAINLNVCPFPTAVPVSSDVVLAFILHSGLIISLIITRFRWCSLPHTLFLSVSVCLTPLMPPLSPPIASCQ